MMNGLGLRYSPKLRTASGIYYSDGAFADVAQWLEQGFHKAKAAGSNPAVGTLDNSPFFHYY